MPPGDAAILHISSSRAHQARRARGQRDRGRQGGVELGLFEAATSAAHSCHPALPWISRCDCASQLRQPPAACMLIPCAFFSAVGAPHRGLCSGQGGAAGADACPGHQLGSQSQVRLPLATATSWRFPSSLGCRYPGLPLCCNVVTRSALPPLPPLPQRYPPLLQGECGAAGVDRHRRRPRQHHRCRPRLASSGWAPAARLPADSNAADILLPEMGPAPVQQTIPLLAYNACLQCPTLWLPPGYLQGGWACQKMLQSCASSWLTPPGQLSSQVRCNNLRLLSRRSAASSACYTVVCAACRG